MEALQKWCEDQIEILRDRIELIESGKIRFHRQELGGPMIDTTGDDLAADKANLARLEEMVAAIQAKG